MNHLWATGYPRAFLSRLMVNQPLGMVQEKWYYSTGSILSAMITYFYMLSLNPGFSDSRLSCHNVKPFSSCVKPLPWRQIGELLLHVAGWKMHLTWEPFFFFLKAILQRFVVRHPTWIRATSILAANIWRHLVKVEQKHSQHILWLVKAGEHR